MDHSDVSIQISMREEAGFAVKTDGSAEEVLAALVGAVEIFKDNIAFAKKFIQDALVETGVLRNDGWSEIEGFTDNFALDPKNPRVEVTIEEMEGVKRNGKRKN